MMGWIRDRQEDDSGLTGEVLDRPHLEHYTMHDQRLAAEVLGLFLAQLPATLRLVEKAETAVDWRFATHALKGSAAAVGAQRLRDLALGLEALAFPGDLPVRLLRVQAIKVAAAEFREVARQSYPDVAEA